MSPRPRPQRLVAAKQWLEGYRPVHLRADLRAGITTAVVMIPQAMGYALLAGLPPIVGLYAAFAPAVAYSLFGTSRRLSVGPVATDSLIVLVALNAVSQSGTQDPVVAAAVLALLVGAIQLLLGLLRMGELANFLSRPVISGFSSAAAVIVFASQFKHLLGIDAAQSHAAHRVVFGVVERLSEVKAITVGLGLGALLMLWGLQRLWPRFPRALAVVVLATALVSAADLEAAGVAVVGQVPAGLPSLRLPMPNLELLRALLPTAVTLAFVSFVESVSIAKHLSKDEGGDIEPNRELTALGLANFAAGLFGGYPVAGGFSRSAVNVSAGARTLIESRRDPRAPADRVGCEALSA